MRAILGLKNYKSIADHIYEALRADIAQGKLSPGERLTPGEIAASLGCSPMPVRDAIRRLAAEGFVTISPRKETTVASLSLEEMRELFAIRAVLEGFAASLACPALTEDDLRKLEEAMEGMAARLGVNDLKGWFRFNQQFHFHVFERAQNKMLRGILEALWDKTLRLPSKVLLGRPDFVARRMREHQDILRALQARDAQAVERSWRYHIARSGEETGRFFSISQAAKAEGSRVPLPRRDRRMRWQTTGESPRAE